MRRFLSVCALLLLLIGSATAAHAQALQSIVNARAAGAAASPIVQAGGTNKGTLPLNSSAAYSGTASFASNVTAGNKAIVGIGFRDATGSTYCSPTPCFSVAVSVSAGTCTLGSFTKDASNFFFDGTPRQHAAYVYSAAITGSGSCTIQVAVTGGVSGKGGGIFLYEVSGLTGFTTSNGASGAAGSAATASTTFTSSAFLVSVADFNDAATDIHCTLTGFTIVPQNGTNNDFGSCYGLGSVVSSPTTFNMQDSANLQWNIVGAVYN